MTKNDGTPKPLLDSPPTRAMQRTIQLFVLAPLIAAVVGAFAAWKWGWGPSWLDIVMVVLMYTITCSGVGVGFHRYLTHSSFKANRALKIGLAIAGSLAVEGPPIQWVADHRRHHAFSDKEGDPHSPWRFGTDRRDVRKGLYYAHVGWLFDREFTNRERFAPDLLADKDIRAIDRLFPLAVVVSLVTPGLIGGLVMGTWHAVFTGILWAGVVRMGLLHHVTWSVNSICHVVGSRPFKARDKATNCWPLAIPSFGEAWHNLHHADPTCARHGVRRGEIDINARIIRVFEMAGWATDVRWPTPQRLAKLTKPR